jgi:hypothetical protein
MSRHKDESQRKRNREREIYRQLRNEESEITHISVVFNQWIGSFTF